MRKQALIRALSITLAITSYAAGLQAAPFYFGMGTHIGQNKLNTAEAMSLYSLGGFNSLRDEAYWHRIEREKDQLVYPSSLTDLETTIGRIRKSGGAPMIALDYNNAFYDLGDIPTTDTGLAGFTRYARFVASHFKGNVPLYEVWNEWNIGLGSNQKPRTIRPVADYIRLLRPTMDAVRSVDPSAKLIAGAVAGPDDKWIDEFISRGGLKGVDGFSVHPYVYQRPSGQNRPEDASDWLAKLSAKLTAANQGRPMDIYVTEIGWPNHQGKAGWTEDQTADFLLRFHMLVRAQPTIRGVWWYELRNSGKDPMEKEHNFGLVTKDLGVKPAFKALKVAVSLLSEGSKVSVSNPAKGVYKAQINTGQEQCTAYWAREGQVNYAIPARDLSGRVAWGTLPDEKAEAPTVVTETPLITCRQGG